MTPSSKQGGGPDDWRSGHSLADALEQIMDADGAIPLAALVDVVNVAKRALADPTAYEYRAARDKPALQRALADPTAYEYRAARDKPALHSDTGHRTAWYTTRHGAIQAAEGFDWRKWWLERRVKAGAPRRIT